MLSQRYRRQESTVDGIVEPAGFDPVTDNGAGNAGVGHGFGQAPFGQGTGGQDAAVELFRSASGRPAPR